MEIKFLKLDASALKPEYKTDGASGMDIAACLKEKVLIEPNGGIVLIPTGIAIELPYGYEAQLRPRSGLSLKYGISMPNSPATIDSDYRGEIKVILINLGKDVFTVNPGDRIAQMIISKFERATLCEYDVLNATKRGEKGLGHTGV